MDTNQDLDQLIRTLQRELELSKEQLKPLTNELEAVKAQMTALNNKRLELVKKTQEIKHRTDKLPEELKKLEQRREKLQHIKLIRQDFNDKTLTAPWRKENRTDGKGALNHQIEGGIDLAIEGKGYVFDKRGLGKTLTSLVWADLIGTKKLIVVVPNDIASQYVREIKLWAPHRTVFRFFQLKEIERDVMFEVLKSIDEWTIVINYEAWRKDWGIVSKLMSLQAEAIVCDEAHLINKTKNLQWKGVWSLTRMPNHCPACHSSEIMLVPDLKAVSCMNCGNQDAFDPDALYDDKQFKWLSIKNVIVMTGTPILNRPQEFYPLARIVDPDTFNSEREFLYSYCVQTEPGRWSFKYGGLDHLIKRLGPKVLQRDRKSAGIVIPPQDVQIHELEFDAIKYPKQAEAIRQIKHYAQLVLDNEGSVMNITVPLTLILRLRQAIVWPAGIQLVERDIFGREISRKNLEVYESIKMDWAVEMIQQLLGEGERVILFSQFTQPLNVLSKKLNELNINNAVLSGETPGYLRLMIEKDFDPNRCGPNPMFDVLLANYKSGGTGLNLHAATQVIMLDREWNPGKEEQAKGRVDRIGTTRDTTVHIPVVNGTIDDWMNRLIESKQVLTGEFSNAMNLARNLRDALDLGDF